MPHKKLEIQEQKILKKLRKNSLVAGVSVLAGLSLLIPAFSLEGSKLDYQEFCFLPKKVSNGSYCNEEKIYKGVAWRVALERKKNQTFKTKITLLDYIPAQNPNAGVYGICSAGFFAAAFLMMKQASHDLQDNLDLAVWNKKSLVLERAFANEVHLGIESLRNDHEQEFIKEMMNRSHGEAMQELMSEGEQVLAAEKFHQSKQLSDAEIQLALNTLNAQSAEQIEKAAKHRVETEKLSKAKQIKTGTERTVDDEAKEELVGKLKSHEDGWLYTLVMTNKPIFLIGSQGSWKSYCSATIALCRFYLKNQKVNSITDPHFNKNAGESWKELIALEPECYGGAQDWDEVNEGIQQGFIRWNKRTLQDEPLTSIWDEQTNWALHEECARSSKDFIGRVISDPRKANEAPLVITHSFTNAGTGGGAGFAAAREEGILQLWLNSDNEMKPLFKGKLIGFKDGEGELIDEMKITIPKDWFNPKEIRKLMGSK